MKTTPPSNRSALQADPRIVKKTRRDNAAYASSGGLFSEQENDYLHQPARSPHGPQLPEFGRPGL